MSEPQPPLLAFDILSTTTPSLLNIEVKNISGAVCAKPVLIEVKLPRQLVDEPIRQAVEKARTNTNPKNRASLGGVVSTAAGWSVWAFNDPEDHLVVLQLFNNRDQQDKPMASPRIEADAAFTLGIPLAKQTNLTEVTIQCGYRADGKRVDKALELKLAGPNASTPSVQFFTNHSNPTTLNPRDEVKISWKVEKAVSATLRGPLPGGNSELTLCTDSKSAFWIEEGFFTTYAVGPATYILDAEVSGPKEGDPNVQVIRTLILDIFTAEKYAYVNVHPGFVLPNGLVEIDWAVWGVQTANIRIVGSEFLKLELTEKSLSGTYQGTGSWRVNAPNERKKQATQNVYLEITGNLDQRSKTKAEINVTPWDDPHKPNVTGKPLGLAVAAPMMALLTSDGLWTAEVGKDDTAKKVPSFKKAATTAEPKAWLTLTTLGESFVVLRQTARDGLQLERYDSRGRRQGAIDLPDIDQGLVNHPSTVFDLVGFGNRVYVVAEAEASVPRGPVRRAFSVRFDPQAEQRSEPLLEMLSHYRLLTFDGALYVLNCGSGRMLRFSLSKKEELEQLYVAKSATDSRGRSMIGTGLLVPLGPVLAVLSPSSVPQPDSEVVFDLLNVKDFAVTGQKPKKQGDVPQDLVYNPQKDEWTPCGHGLDTEPGAVAAFRGGLSDRLWVVQPDGEMHSLSGASAELFAPCYFQGLPAESLRPFLNKKRQFTLENNSRIHFLPMSDTSNLAPPESAAYRKGGLNNFSSTGPAELTSQPKQIMPMDGNTATVELKYNEADPSPVTVRYLARRPPLRGARTDMDYMLEVTFSGPDLSSATSVFKRIAVDGQGTLSSSEMFETMAQHSTDSPIKLPRPKQFDETIKFVVANSSHVDLKSNGLEYSPVYYSTGRSVAVALQHTMPDFSFIFDPRKANGGELLVNLDFSKPPGMEVSAGSEPQKSRIRFNPDKATTLYVKFVTLLKPGDAPLRLEGIMDPINAVDRLVYVCQIGSRSVS